MTPPILQVVGFKNSGKTTVVSNMIQFASENGFKLGSIKHHGHGGPPDLPDEWKDSDRHLRAGALVSVVEGEGKLHLVAQKAVWQLEEILFLYQAMNVDGILVEGYKKAHYPKIVMLHQKEDLVLLEELEDVVGVIHDYSIPKIDLPSTSFLFTEKELYCHWFLDYLRR
ncbi:molybdopterin-guanine dinucleotide biosynthesis protein B [Sutcliffiella sp. FSL R7-0096]|uniref:molybdopterin-guanine dinucleotide biosynthesis protein B n=1 Tax=Sutcliffiella sp. FSL R7-0096 TaxID=2921670 RepID=UPI00315AEC6A